MLRKVKEIEDVQSIIKSCKHTHNLIQHSLFNDALQFSFYYENYITHLVVDDEKVMPSLISLLYIFLDGLYCFVFD